MAATYFKWLGDSPDILGGPRKSCTVRGMEFFPDKPVLVESADISKKLSGMKSFEAAVAGETKPASGYVAKRGRPKKED